MNAVLVVLAAGAGTYALRVSMLVLAARGGLPRIVERASAFALPVSFAAIATTSLSEHLHGAAGDAVPLAALLVAAVVARRTGSANLALGVGMPTLWLLSFLLGP
jgi:branched-subunit amino acid transport protein